MSYGLTDGQTHP